MYKIGLPVSEGDIRFYVANKEVLRLCANGNLLYKGEVITDEKDLVRGLKEFFDGIHEEVI